MLILKNLNKTTCRVHKVRPRYLLFKRISIKKTLTIQAFLTYCRYKHFDTLSISVDLQLPEIIPACHTFT